MIPVAGARPEDAGVLTELAFVAKLRDRHLQRVATVQILELAGEIAQLSRIRNAVYEHWQHKNAAKSGRNQVRG